jgi:hypothetical protein
MLHFYIYRYYTCPGHLITRESLPYDSLNIIHSLHKIISVNISDKLWKSRREYKQRLMYTKKRSVC